MHSTDSGTGGGAISRRTWLSLCWALGGAVLLVTARGILSVLSYRPETPARRYELPAPSTVPHKGPGFWVDRDPRGWFAFSDICPHLGCEPEYSRERNAYLCPCHGSRFGEGGRFLSGPAGKDLPRVRISRTDTGLLLVEPGETVSADYRLPVKTEEEAS